MSARLVAVVGLLVIGALVLAAIASRGTTTPDSSKSPAASRGTSVLPSTTASDSSDLDAERPALPDRGLPPELRSIDGWLQSGITSLEELRGQVVAVQFWTFGCSNCKATLPHMQQLYAKYHDQGFEIVGIHAPEFAYEAEVDNIAAAAEDLGVTWPIALDTQKRTFHFWQEGTRAFWPRIYLLDRDGHVRYDHIGEGRYDEIDAAVAALLAEAS
jgi:thiol-disulfide isomerase/thioredoxin